MEEILQTLRNIQNITLKSIQDDIKAIKTDMILIKNFQAVQLEKQNKIEDKISEIEEKMKAANVTEKSKNVIFYNIKEDEDDNISIFTKIQDIFTNAEVKIPDICVVDAFRLGNPNINKVRPVLIKLIAQRWKRLIFDNEDKIKDLGYAIASDLPKELRDLKNKLLKARYNLRQEGKDPVLKKYKLYVDNRCLTTKEVYSTANNRFTDLEVIEDNISKDANQNQEKATPITAAKSTSSLDAQSIEKGGEKTVLPTRITRTNSALNNSVKPKKLK